VKVRDLMSHEVTTLGRNQTLSVAEELMNLQRIRHLPVVEEDGRLAGIVSQRDLFHSGLVRALGYGRHASAQVRDMLPVKEVMSTEVTTTEPEASLEEAARLMCEKKIGCLPVVDKGRLVGILTEGDFVAHFAGRKRR
jgi:CBS domain-containing membrane protein